MHSSYKEVKNFIHNEAQITKEEIRAIIRETVREEVNRIVGEKQDYIDVCVKSYVERLIREGLTDGGTLLFGFRERVSSTLSDQVGKFIANQLQIDVSVIDQEDKVA
ncbi:hypothetical protein ACFVS2_21140 [Brevibacillus sp. NPDC058079]|uniref:hypothetical protein n=1 Tax=Brevibacillus sp. NPDC058079 TaxID=3346330 RepID=UPI0036E51CA7